jgi:hypothetical protein
LTGKPSFTCTNLRATYGWSRDEAIPEGIRVRQPFEKQYAKLTSDYINAMYAWAEKPLQGKIEWRRDDLG